MGPGSHHGVGLFLIKARRTKPIRLKVQWRKGEETGSYVQTIAPEEDGSIRIK